MLKFASDFSVEDHVDDGIQLNLGYAAPYSSYSTYLDRLQ